MMSASRAANHLVDLLDDGTNSRFEFYFGRLTALPHGRVVHALYESGARGLAVACKGAGFNVEIFAKIFFWLHGGREDPLFRTSNEFRSAVDFFHKVDAGKAQRMLDTWRQTPATA